MTISLDDLRNGLAVEKDLVLPARPEHPEMRESTSIWMFDEEGRFGFPRMGIEAEAASWDDRTFQANIAFADGRVLDGAGRGPAPSPIGPDGRPTVLGAGGQVYTCLEPFRRWRLLFEGSAVDTRVEDQIANCVDREKRVAVRLEADMTMVTPAWVQESEQSSDNPEENFMGLGYRFEHLFRAEGVFTVDGRDQRFRATGLCIHRQSIRRLEGFYGHCWQSAVFPDGRAFGYIAYPPKPDGSQYNEGYVYEDGKMHPARAVVPPWLRRTIGSGDDVSVELEYAGGRVRIDGATTLSTFTVGNPHLGGLTLQQSGVRYRWGEQAAYGMIERSSAL